MGFFQIPDGIYSTANTYTVVFFQAEPSAELELTDDDREFLASIKVKV
jgi:hypothetical protein